MGSDFLPERVYVLTVDLNAIQQNWLTLSASSLASVAGVIKADAYGLGARQVGCALYAVGCRTFFLASVEEAVTARDFLPADAAIYVLGGLRNVDISELFARNLIPMLCSVYDVEQWLKFKSSAQVNAVAGLKINTGMTRFGLDERDFSLLCTDEFRLKAINPELLISHLACADEVNHLQNNIQLNRFLKSLEQIKRVLSPVRASLANSSGIFLGKEWHFDLLRPGAALYGINPTPLDKNPMLPVVRLALPILQVRSLSASEFIGYGATASLPTGARVAVVAGGYADGVHRTLGAHPEGILLGQRVKVIGRISMDSMIFDISHIAASDEELMQASVEVIGDDCSIDRLMKTHKTLGYEVLTSLGSRYKRHYLPGAL